MMIAPLGRLARIAGILGVLAGALFVTGCGGSSDSGGSGGGGSGAASLQKVEYGRLVDVYAYRRVDPDDTDRRDTVNRVPVRIPGLQDVVIRPDIESQDLYDATGGARPTAWYRFLPFDVEVGHDELVILWDDRYEVDDFQTALDTALNNLVEVSAAFRDQNTLIRPIPVVPRNAALKLTFDRDLGVDSSFYDINRSAIQLLRFRDDPNVVPASQAFEVAGYRILADGGPVVVIDTSLVGADAIGRRPSTGLDPSPDSVTANYRIAIPSDGVGSQLNISMDPVEPLNGVDAQGNNSVIRDLRSGNSNDGLVGILSDFDPPMIVALTQMGITAIDFDERIVTLDKRGYDLPLRARLPFVDGIVNDDEENAGLPKGSYGVPTVDASNNAMPLRTGDFIIQTVISSSGQPVRIKAEIIENFEVGIVENDPGYPAPGLTPGGSDGGELQSVRLRLATVTGVDSLGLEVRMEFDADGQGADCQAEARYYEFLAYAPSLGQSFVSDAVRRGEFVLASPEPLTPPEGALVTGVSPLVNLATRFSEPLDFTQVNSLDNYCITQEEATIASFQEMLSEPKSATLLMVSSRLVDVNQDGTLLRLDAPLGLFHEQGEEELYWFHIDLGEDGVKDLSGNSLDIWDLRQAGTTTIGGLSVDVPLQNFSQQFRLLDAAEENLVGWLLKRFADNDEDGTRPGSLDYFGQFFISDGRLQGAAATRRSRTADDQNLGSIRRWDRGECVGVRLDPPQSLQPFRPPPINGDLYLAPNSTAANPQPPAVFQGQNPFGGIVEPHTARGARMQLTYREDDFSLSYHATDDLNIDVEQLYWAPWNDMVVLYDSFDRYTMRLGHSRKRPDLTFWIPSQDNPECFMACSAMNSGLSTTFSNNPLNGAQNMTTVVKDQRYVINPNDAFRAASGVKYVPYPTFEDRFTWRDSREVSWDSANQRATGLGGSVDSGTQEPNDDWTASVSSPWIKDDPITAIPEAIGSGWAQPPVFVQDRADFLGTIDNDHDPIALPLLVDISVWPDDTRQVATAGNLFHLAYVGPIWPGQPNGYYNSSGFCGSARPIWPLFRVYSFGGPDLNDPGEFTLVRPDLETIARGGVIKDGLLGDGTNGLYQAPAGDDHLHWARVDLVRRVSMVTAGFFDTLLPNQHALIYPENLEEPFPAPLPPAEGRPDFSTIDGGLIRVDEVFTVFDPPLGTQAGGTNVEVELRFADNFDNPELYYPIDQGYNPGTDKYNERGNLLNPNYACEAYRYAMPVVGYHSNVLNGPAPRVLAQGLTPYVSPDNVDSVRDPLTGLLPRYMNFRLIIEANVDATPAIVPALRDFSLVYRMKRR